MYRAILYGEVVFTAETRIDVERHVNRFKDQLRLDTIIEQDTELHKFVIIYGSKLIIKKFKNISEGITFCQNNLDQSNEIIIRKITNIA